MRPSEVLSRATEYLEAHDVEGPRENAEVLLMSVLGSDRAGLFARSEGLSSAEARAFGRALCRRCTGEPLQHVTGEQAFRTLTLIVRPGVFIPRPETEVVVDVALAAIASTAAPRALDVGTGTGAVAISIAREHPGADVVAVDLSAEAVELARFNASRAGARVDVLQGDLFEPVPERLKGHLDLVVSNPPYVDPADADTLSREVLADPSLALFGGTEVHERLGVDGHAWLRPGGSLVLEIGADQGGEVEGILGAAGYEQVRTQRDLAGCDRVVSGVRSGAPGG